MFRKQRLPAWHKEHQREIEVLALYNSETARGLLHTKEWQAQMEDLQREFDSHRKDWNVE